MYLTWICVRSTLPVELTVYITEDADDHYDHDHGVVVVVIVADSAVLQPSKISRNQQRDMIKI